MGAVEIIIIIACASIVIGTVISAIIRKKKGKTSCGSCSSCSGCSSCSHCSSKSNTKKTDK